MSPSYILQSILFSFVFFLFYFLLSFIHFTITKSFKERGARNALLKLNAEEKVRGVISASLGNHAQGLSFHANLLNVPCTVVMPKAAPIMKIQKCRSFGATVLIHVSSKMHLK